MNYAFVIDNRKCIGCHACSTACKSENAVPLGVYRTWVKYVETGVYPYVRRHFQVTRCNHCANPPCVRICPVSAMYQRDDGIVEFDPDACIGCKACMQACPYDAIYIDPETRTAAKCHFCAHRIELGLEPACVVVCPVHAILFGDLDDPNSEVSRVLASTEVVVRKPEQGTAPKLFYIEGNDWAMHPTATERTPETFMFADVVLPYGETGEEESEGETVAAVADGGVPVRAPQPQGLGQKGAPIPTGRVAEQMVQVAYNAQHRIPWHWPVPLYLVTKGLAGGLLAFLGLGHLLGLFPFDLGTFVTGGFLSLLFTGITAGLLVYDLERPGRFFYILIRPQWRSWLARGAFLLLGFTVVVGLWWLLEFLGPYLGWLPAKWAEMARAPGLGFGGLLAIGVIVYTAFLFGQAEGRDLWQSSLLPFHLLTQALMVGTGLLLLLPTAEPLASAARWAFFGSLVLDLVLLFLGEFGMPHATEVAARAAHEIVRGRYRRHFWWGGVGLGHLLPLGLVLLPSPLAWGIGGLAAILGLYLYEYAFVMAPQEIPNS